MLTHIVHLRAQLRGQLDFKYHPGWNLNILSLLRGSCNYQKWPKILLHVGLKVEPYQNIKFHRPHI